MIYECPKQFFEENELPHHDSELIHIANDINHEMAKNLRKWRKNGRQKNSQKAILRDDSSSLRYSLSKNPGRFTS